MFWWVTPPAPMASCHTKATRDSHREGSMVR